MQRILGISLLFLVPSITLGQSKTKEGLVLFKDGFSFQGKIIEQRDIIIDPATGASFNIPAGGLCMYLDDGVRRIFFSHTQLHDVIPRTTKEVNDRMAFFRSGSRDPTTRGILPGWQLEDSTEWNSKWVRYLKWRTQFGVLTMEQRIIALTPYQAQIQSIGYRFEISYLTKEFTPDAIRVLINNYMKEQKSFKDAKTIDKRMQLAKFLHQAGWHWEADKELAALEETYFDQKEKIAPLREAARSAIANIHVEDLERAYKVGQHQKARDLLAQYQKDDLSSIVSDRHKLMAQETKRKYVGLKEKVDEARKALLALPDYTTVDKSFWQGAAETVAAGLNEDTFARVESFLQYAQQYRRDVIEKRKPSQTAEEVLSLALSGWLQGNFAAEPDERLARQLWATHDMVRAYVKASDPAKREKIIASVSRADEVHMDQLSRMIQMLPPPRSPEKTTADVTERDIGLLDSPGGSYLVQLPPEYQPYRSYPLLLLLHGGREDAKTMLGRFTDLAARNGYILAAPLWGKGLKAKYGYTDDEQVIVLDTLRDLRQVFNVDSDRTYLLGWESGGDMAYDVGLSHPDQFAGVIPINGDPQSFPTRYWSNGQYLPFYVVDGERNFGNPKANRTLFKDWVGSHYPSIYVEYKGRGSEWYQAELESIFDWMSRKKRAHPTKQMGVFHTGGGSGEEFKTMRRGDNKFYWLSTTGIHARHINDARAWQHHVLPATLQASVSLGNELELKAKAKGGVEVKGAKIWTSFQIRTKGVNQVSLWISPAIHDFKRPLLVHWNGDRIGPPRIIEPSLAVLLEDYARTGDRNRLHYARIDLP